ncbi:unnamed protein product, partial [Didymodactylos carnosus]
NKALRTHDIDTLFSLRFYIKDLYNQLKAEYDKAERDFDRILYRGQTISDKELNLMKENIGEAIYINSFLSITFDLDTARGFAEKNEVLVMAGSIFQISSVYFDDTISLWIVELNLCDEKIYEFNELYQWEKQEVAKARTPLSFDTLLLRMNLYNKAEKYYQRLLDDLLITNPTSDYKIDCYLCLKGVAEKRGDYDIALAYCCLSAEQSKNYLLNLIRSYKEMGLAYLNVHSKSDALDCQFKALTIQELVKNAKEKIADAWFNIGSIYRVQLCPENDLALEYYFKTLKTFKELQIHDEIARCYEATGKVYQAKKKKAFKDEALNYFLHALIVIENNFPSYCPYLVSILESIAGAYQSMRKSNEALKYYQNILDIK